MKQTRKASLIESLVNVVVGFIVGTIANVTVLPLFGFHPSLADASEISFVFVAVSIARSFALRRGFEALRIGGWLP